MDSQSPSVGSWVALVNVFAEVVETAESLQRVRLDVADFAAMDRVETQGE
jgi:hypothetical protein